MAFVLGCATATSPASVARPVEAIAPRPLFRAPGSYHAVQKGQTLWRIAQAYGMNPSQLAAANHLPSMSRVPAGEELFIPLPIDSPQFFWPLLGEIRSGNPSQGVEIAAAPGTMVRAARRGRVAVATASLAGQGPTVVLAHEDGYASVYAGVEALLVQPGAEVAQGSPIARLGKQPLHFEIRHEAAPVPVLSLLPKES